jgi:hypothetical protein
MANCPEEYKVYTGGGGKLVIHDMRGIDMNDDDQKTPDNKGKRHRQLTKEVRGAKIKAKLKVQRAVPQRGRRRRIGSITKKVQPHGRGGITSGANLQAEDLRVRLRLRAEVKKAFQGKNVLLPVIKTQDQAQRLTELIRQEVRAARVGVARLFLEAEQQNVHTLLGYRSFKDYVTTEYQDLIAYSTVCNHIRIINMIDTLNANGFEIGNDIAFSPLKRLLHLSDQPAGLVAVWQKAMELAENRYPTESEVQCALAECQLHCRESDYAKPGDERESEDDDAEAWSSMCGDGENADDDFPSRGKAKARTHGESHKDLMRQTGQRVEDAIGKIPQDSAHIGALLNFVKSWLDTVTGGLDHQAVVRAFIDIFEVATRYDEARGAKSQPIEELISAIVKKLETNLRDLNVYLPVKTGRR